jgi:hypothetical protein
MEFCREITTAPGSAFPNKTVRVPAWFRKYRTAFKLIDKEPHETVVPGEITIPQEDSSYGTNIRLPPGTQLYEGTTKR